MALPTTIWTPTSGIGEAGSEPNTLLMTEDDFELSTEDGFSLLIEDATYTPLDATIWIEEESN